MLCLSTTLDIPLKNYILIQRVYVQGVFGQKHVVNETPVAPKTSAFGAMANFLVPKFTGGISADSSNDRSSLAVDQSKLPKKERHAVRPPVEHNWSLPGRQENLKSPQIFQHELLQNFSINMFCKVGSDLIIQYTFMFTQSKVLT